MSAQRYVCPWWCHAQDHSRQGVYELDQLGTNQPAHRAVFDAPVSVDVVMVDDIDCPPVLVLGGGEMSGPGAAARARAIAQALLQAAELLDTFEG